jgi:hypothetical protein
MAINGNVIGKWNQTSTAWKSGIYSTMDHNIAKTDSQFFERYNVNTPVAVSQSQIAGYTGKTLSILTPDTNTRSMHMTDDGTKLFITATGGDAIYRWNLSTPYEITTATYLNSFAFGTQVVDPSGFSISPDGTKLFVLSLAVDIIYSYTMSTPFDLTTMTYDTVALTVTTQEATPLGMRVKPDGTKLWVIGTTNDILREYTMSTPWSLATAVFSTSSIAVTTQDTSPQDFCWSGDGLKLYVLGATVDNVFEYTASTAFAANTLTYTRTWDVGQEIPVTSTAGLVGMYFVPNTKKLYLLEPAVDLIFQLDTYTTDRAGFKWWADTASPTSFKSVSALAPTVRFRPDGKYYFVSRANKIETFQCTTPWVVQSSDTSISVYDIYANDGTTVSAGTRFTFSSDGTKYYTHTTAGYVTQYTLRKAWDVTTAYFDTGIQLTTGTLYSIRFSADGLRLYHGVGDNNVYIRTLTTPFDLATITGVQTTWTHASYINTTHVVYDVMIGDGTAVYISTSQAYVSKFKLSTPYDFNTATYAGRIYLGNITSTTTYGVASNPDGTRFYASGNLAINQIDVYY